MSHQNEQDVAAMIHEEQDRLMRENAQSWILGATIWHFARVDEVRSLLDRASLGCWYVVADAMPPQTISLIVSLHDGYWAVVADETTAPEIPSPLVIQSRFEQLTSSMKERAGKPLWISNEVL